MLTKSLLALTLLAALSASAQAASTISDRTYWPNEAKQTAQARPFVAQRDPYSAFAYDRGTAGYQPATAPTVGGPAWRYQGGPKSR
ncbi:hypothetical protein [Bradyrhizobium sp. CCBAU 51627]|uniref:hypothetical protein n=1 Tax=Bradyrhizobium sp. CCBAU 51627 TaxID=1325088 RepID=UPI002306BEFB|nr:hypothetical protein [Bradyrhizobium sp. CCBAU 51627]MDA9436232.1 hypothetical protein [Bradyrhizobium sp. CCBAU 51627]